MSNYLPLNELNGQEFERISWRVELPDYVPTNRIGVNLERLNLLARLGGLETLLVTTYAGDTTSITASPNNIDGRGQATASMNASISKAKTQQSEASGVDIDIPYDYQWQQGEIRLNSTEILERIKDKGGLRDARAWAQELDAIMSAGMRETATKSLLKNPSLKEKLRLPIGATLLLGIESVIFHHHNIELIEAVTEDTMLWQFVVLPWIARRERYSSPGRKISLVPAIALDRWLATSGLAQTLPLVKTIAARD